MFLRPTIIAIATLFFLTGCNLQVTVTEEEIVTSEDTSVNTDTTTDDVVDNNIEDPVETEEPQPLVTWDRPMTRNNGETLFSYDIGGFKLKVTDVATSETTILELSINSFPDDVYFSNLEGFEAGEYLVSIATYDIEGLESLYSDAIAVTL